MVGGGIFKHCFLMHEDDIKHKSTSFVVYVEPSHAHCLRMFSAHHAECLGQGPHGPQSQNIYSDPLQKKFAGSSISSGSEGGWGEVNDVY